MSTEIHNAGYGAASAPATSAIIQHEEKPISDAERSEATNTAEANATDKAAPPAQEGNAAIVESSASSGNTADDGTEKAAGPAPEDKRSRGKTFLIMLGLCMATFLAALDVTIVTTALPTIAAAFNASSADYTWIGSAYLLAAAAATPTWGKISDIFGRKPTILTANVVFLVGSLICALSVNIKMLIAGRVIQGIGGGGLIVLTQICISDLFSMRYVMILATWVLRQMGHPHRDHVYQDVGMSRLIRHAPACPVLRIKSNLSIGSVECISASLAWSGRSPAPPAPC